MRRQSYRERLLVALAICFAMPAAAQNEAGMFAAIQGKVQYQRRGVWNDAAVGLPLQVGDRIRTSTSERVKLVMQDDSVLDLGPGSELVIDDSLSDAANQRQQAAFRLFQGRTLVRVSSAYPDSKGHFEIETPNAIASVQGTEFLISHDPAGEVTEVEGISGEVEVVGKISAMGGGKVRLGPQMVTRIRKGRLPSEAEQLSDTQVRQSLQGIEIAGTGKRDGLNVFHPVLAGRLISPEDVPGGKPVEAAATAGLGTSAPGMSPASALSMDVYTNTQPLNVFKAFPPGQVPAGGVHVQF